MERPLNNLKIIFLSFHIRIKNKQGCKIEKFPIFDVKDEKGYQNNFFWSSLLTLIENTYLYLKLSLATTAPSQMSATEGGSFTLTVETEDSSTVEWYHNGEKLNSCAKTRITNDSNGSTLLISDVTKEDAGSYKMVTSDGGVAESVLVVEHAPLPKIEGILV